MINELLTVGGCAAGAVVLGGVVYYGIPTMVRKREVGMLRRVAVERKALALTYDDGPGPELTRRLLDLLAARQVKATFFLLGRRAVAAPDLVDQLQQAGHEVGCHTHDHLNAWKVGPVSAVRDISRGYDSLSRWMPGNATFRPTYGKTTLVTRRALSRRGSPVGWWTIDSCDTHDPLPPPDTAVKSLAAEGGGVVLLHDFDREEDAARRAEYVLQTTTALLDHAARTGLRVCKLSELLPARPIT